MQLRRARLCLDCEELHDANRCPSCASKAFAFLTQWVPADEQCSVRHSVHVPQLDEAATSQWAAMLFETAPGWAWRAGTSLVAALATLSPFD